MIRKIALSLICVGALSLTACNRNDSSANRRENAMFSPDEGVWYNGNGERIHHSQLTQVRGGDWYAASNEERRLGDDDRYTSGYETDQGVDRPAKPCTCTPEERAAKQRMRNNN